MTDELKALEINSTIETQRFLLAQIEQLTLIVSSRLVAEIILIERSQVLPLPFYNSVILGCYYHAGQILPLIATDRQLGIRTTSPTREILTIIRLSESAEHLAGVGLLVDKVLGSQSGDRLPAEIFDSDVYFPATEGDAPMKLFSPQLLSREIFVPLRWQAAT
ncbi:chemotaxis protein CheW [Candidatus Gracilibacteria bacterium]|nr:chemotaxis protein CheW [Candidatus Gracilibacteria bacterium]NJM86674.1 chemotaxis protein CheW [Hydrococcus sp. RU_2_2]NJP20585.1 chemotaxis protein CheW [Hydrococcus sp. CRU_1_1]